MNRILLLSLSLLFFAIAATGAVAQISRTRDPQQSLERTCFQTGQSWSGAGNLRSDVAIVYGIGPDLPDRIATWREHAYGIHIMTGVAWGAYQDYISGKFDGVNHQDEEQTDRHGNPHSHGGDIFYMCPGTNYARYLCLGVQRALNAGAEAIHLEEPEFWVQDGYEEGFKREWRDYYGEDWQPPHSSADAQWRCSKLKYYLYRRALQQIFDYVQEYNRKSGRHVRCYVPTHSLLNYSHWRIVSPESSLARLSGCDGYIAQVWTGTARTPNMFRGALRERTFETAFLEYGAMQNLVRATGRTVWYLNDPVEDDPSHTWQDYRANWESTLVASLFQPEVWRYEVAPWPERVFAGRYKGKSGELEAIPPAYATELQIAMNALNDMKQPRVQWDCGTTGIGVLVSDSLMFERGDPSPSDPHLSHVYGLALPLLKRGIPITPVQLENVTVTHYLDSFHVLFLTYHGMKPLSPDVHASLASWVKKGGVLVMVDDDSDPFNRVREWWDSGGLKFATPREHLFEQLGLRAEVSPSSSRQSSDFPHVETGSQAPQARSLAIQQTASPRYFSASKGAMIWLRENPAHLARSGEGDLRVVEVVKRAAGRARLRWRETNYLLLRRGPYVIAAGLDESVGDQSKVLRGRFVNLFDPELQVQKEIKLKPGTRWFLLDLDVERVRVPRVLASACNALALKRADDSFSLAVEGVADTAASLLLSWPGRPPQSIALGGQHIKEWEYSPADHLLRIRFLNQPTPRQLEIKL